MAAVVVAGLVLAVAAVVVDAVVVGAAPAVVVAGSAAGRVRTGSDSATRSSELRRSTRCEPDRFARRWTVSRTISVRTSGADWARGRRCRSDGLPAGGEGDGGEGAEGDHGRPGGDVMA